MRIINDYEGKKAPTERRRKAQRGLELVSMIGVHATGVPGGYGTAPYQRAAARRDLRKLYGSEPTEADVIEHVLLGRYAEEPYHCICSPTLGASIMQLPAVEYSYHGNGMNSRTVAWAYDRKFVPGAMDELDVELGRASLRHCVTEARAQGCPIDEITAHANHSNKPHDPGPLVWREVVMPVAAELGLRIRPEWTTRGMKPTIRDWMVG